MFPRFLVVNNRDLQKAPQSFWLKEILDVERQAINEGKTDMIDSCTLMRHYGKKLNVVVGPNENIKNYYPR